MAPILRWFLALLGWLAFSQLLLFVRVPVSWVPVLVPMSLLVSVAWLLWLMKEAGRCFSRAVALWLSSIALLAAVASWLLLQRFPVGSVADYLASFLLAAALICIVAGLGVALSTIIRQANLLLPIAVVVTIMDFWTVLGGGFIARVQEQAEKGQQVAQRLMEVGTIKMPVAKGATAAVATPAVGIGDLFFAAFFFALLWRFGLRAQLSYWLAVPLVTAALLLIAIAPVPLALPGLPFLALAVLVPNWQAFRYTSEEKRALFVGALFLLALLAVFTWLARQM